MTRKDRPTGLNMFFSECHFQVLVHLAGEDIDDVLTETRYWWMNQYVAWLSKTLIPVFIMYQTNEKWNNLWHISKICWITLPFIRTSLKLFDINSTKCPPIHTYIQGPVHLIDEIRSSTGICYWPMCPEYVGLHIARVGFWLYTHKW